MIFDFNIFATVLLLIGTVNLFLALVLFNRFGIVAKWFSIIMLFISIWSIAYAFELASNNLDQMLFFIRIEYLGICFLPALWIIFIFKFINKNEWLNNSNYIIILLFPVIDFILVQTNSYHHLHYKFVSIDNSGSFPLLAIESGIAYKIHTLYFYFMLIWGTYLLFITLNKGYLIYKKQYVSLIIAALFPWFVNVFYLFGIRPFGHIDLTPFAFIVTSIAIAFSLLRYNFLKLIPIAREKVIEHMSEGVVVLDWQNRIVDTNAIVLKFLKKTGMELIGENILNIIDQNDELKQVLYLKENKKLVVNTHQRIFEVIINEINPKKGINKGVLLIFRDITDANIAQHKLENQAKELEEINQLKDKLFSIIAHDLKSPFASLISILKILHEGHLTIDEFKEFLPKLTENVDYTSTMLENLLNWSRSQIDAVSIVIEPLVLKSIIDNEITFFNKKAEEKNITISNEVNNDFMINADKSTVQLVFRNLFSNAIKFCNDGDSITIKTKEINGIQTIVFKDTGIGMSEDKVKKLFGAETFTTYGTKNEKGTGLGLLLCKDYIEKNGGAIHVESELKKGTTFYFHFANQPSN